ncbi:hypothetical protein [Candidatus Enterococcus palustris]|uniref:hypothetical protein n=1 Tax=Candidatus Enterococcus palustris TaxID=1834189 RepID=UPI000A335776|nr:hypothetical protein [Enterococcus sp. 7F3_DIV0205]
MSRETYKRERVKIGRNQEYKYTDADVDRIVKQKHQRWQKKRKAKDTYKNQKKKPTSSYNEATAIFLEHNLPFDLDVIECVVNESTEVTKKNAQAIVKFVSSITKEKE